MQTDTPRLPASGRRALLAGMAASPLALHAPAAQALGADARLIAACAELLRMERETRRLEGPFSSIAYDDPRYLDPETGFAATGARVEALRAGYDGLVAFVCETRATSLAGLAAKAAAMRIGLGNAPDGGPSKWSDDHDFIGWSLTSDIDALTGGSVGELARAGGRDAL